MPRTIELEEHRTGYVETAHLSEEEGTTLFRSFGDRLDVQFPSPRTAGRWEITSRGYVGALSLGADATLVIRPKVPIANLARMLQCVYDLPLHTFPQLALCRTVPDLYEQLVRALLARVSGILRKGIHHRYCSTMRDMAAVRGRVRIAEHLRRPSRITVPCAFDERTPDVVDRVLRAGLSDDDLQREARSAYRELQSRVGLVPARPEDIDAIAYDRLTARYQEAHRLCRLLLEGAGPIPDGGRDRTVPFLLDMPRLFERFVARWLATNLPPEIQLRAQERNVVGEAEQVEFIIDLVLYDSNGVPLCVLDTKYKTHGAPAANDVAQVGYYALLKGSPLAGLVYPRPVQREWRGSSGRVRTFRSTFDISGDIERAGEEFVGRLQSLLREHPWESQDEGGLSQMVGAARLRP